MQGKDAIDYMSWSGLVCQEEQGEKEEEEVGFKNWHLWPFKTVWPEKNDLISFSQASPSVNYR